MPMGSTLCDLRDRLADYMPQGPRYDAWLYTLPAPLPFDIPLACVPSEELNSVVYFFPVPEIPSWVADQGPERGADHPRAD